LGAPLVERRQIADHDRQDREPGGGVEDLEDVREGPLGGEATRTRADKRRGGEVDILPEVDVAADRRRASARHGR